MSDSVHDEQNAVVIQFWFKKGVWLLEHSKMRWLTPCSDKSGIYIPTIPSIWYVNYV